MKQSMRKYLSFVVCLICILVAINSHSVNAAPGCVPKSSKDKSGKTSIPTTDSSTSDGKKGVTPKPTTNDKDNAGKEGGEKPTIAPEVPDQESSSSGSNGEMATKAPDQQSSGSGSNEVTKESSGSGSTAPRAKGDPKNRVRKSWSSMNDGERKLYEKVLGVALKSDKHLLFTKLHVGEKNAMVGHSSCGFLMWHRRFLLAYENFLRSLGDEFASVTIPYWNYFQEAAEVINKNVECNSILGCSKFLTDLGGNKGTNQTFSVLGTEEMTGFCTSSKFLGGVCENVDKKKGCKGCIPRGDWAKNETNLGIVPSMLTNVLDHAAERLDFKNFSQELEEDIHNSVHGTLGGAMETWASCWDPIFFSHHAMIDFVHYIYHECHVGEISESDRKSSDKVFGSCTSETNMKISHGASIYMKVDGKDAHEFDGLKEYFEGTGTKYNDYLDAQDLGKHSYSYNLDEFLAKLKINCPKNPIKVSSEKGVDKKKSDGAKTVVDVSNTCKKETKSKNPELTKAQLAEQQLVIECKALKKAGNGKIDEVSEKFKKNFKIRQDKESKCKETLDKVKNGTLKKATSGEECKKEAEKTLGTDVKKLEKKKT